MSRRKFALLALAVSCAGCNQGVSNPAAPKSTKDALARVESALAEARQDIFATPFPRWIGEIMVPDAAQMFQQATRGTALAADADHLMETSKKLANLCLQKSPNAKQVQDAYNEVDACVQKIKAKL